MAIVHDKAAQFKTELASLETDALVRLTRAYVQTLTLLLPQVTQLGYEVSRLEPPLTPNDIYRLDRYQQLVRQMQDELTKLNGVVGNTTLGLQTDLALKGTADALTLIDASLRGENAGLRDFARSFNRLPVKALEQLIGFAGDGSPLNTLLSENGNLTYDKALQTLVDGLVLGKSPQQNAGAFQQAFGSSLDRALRISRTETNRAYREAGRQTYLENSDVVSGYVRLALKDARTCLACLLKDGNAYDLATPLDEHPNGRCSMVPVTRFYIPIQTGREWFDSQDEETQTRILGESRFERWQAGAELDDFIKLHESKQWGNAWVMK